MVLCLCGANQNRRPAQRFSTHWLGFMSLLRQHWKSLGCFFRFRKKQNVNFLKHIARSFVQIYPHSKSSVLNKLTGRLRTFYEFSICCEFKTTVERDDVGKLVGRKCLPKISNQNVNMKMRKIVKRFEILLWPLLFYRNFTFEPV